MRTLASLSMAMLFAGALFGQHHSGGRSGPPNGGFHRGGGFRPGGSGLVGSGFVGSGLVGGGVVSAPYAYPVYLGSGYAYPPDYAPPPPVPQSVMLDYPPQPAPADQSGALPPPGANPEPVSRYDDSPATQPDHYLIALKDHTIYSVVAYWVSGDTLHYFTAGNVHNQASLSLVDRDLTARLNKESGTEVNLPPAK